MSVKINEKFLEGFVAPHELEYMKPMVRGAFESIKNKDGQGSDFLGWVDLPVDYDKEEFARIKAAAEKIKANTDVLIVIGIGGSYLGSRAVIELIKSPLYNTLKKDTPDIYFAGNNISTTALNELLSICEGRRVSVNVISKSGTTTEPAIAFRVFRDLVVKQYGEDGARDHIFVTTDRARGTLKSFADQCGYETFVVPDDVGGRFSVLSAVGLLPIAVAGISIDELMGGAAAAREALSSPNLDENASLKYAAIRNILYNKGKVTEVLVGYEPYAQMLCEWWKQLMGESEGKDKKGLLPDSVIFSTDLHSLGQYIQDGMRNLFETVLNFENCGATFEIPYDEANIDGLNFVAGRDLDYVNKKAMLGTLFAHYDGGVPNMVLDIADRSAHSVGYLIYFFELACAVSGYLLGVNPFNQPGVEDYKRNMFALLGKPGYEDARAALEARMK